MASIKLPIAAVVLAAGSSQRMGEDNKLHLPINGIPMLRHSLQTLLDSDIDEIVVVLGHDNETTRALIADLPLRLVYNDAHLSGQMTSVHCGLTALQDFEGDVMISLADQPGLSTADINYLIAAHQNRSGGEVVVPTYQGKRGNPIIMSENSKNEILAGTRNFGCRKFIENNPDLVQMIEMSNPAVVNDLDTPQEYNSYCENHSLSGSDEIERKANLYG